MENSLPVFVWTRMGGSVVDVDIISLPLVSWWQNVNKYDWYWTYRIQLVNQKGNGILPEFLSPDDEWKMFYISYMSCKKEYGCNIRDENRWFRKNEWKFDKQKRHLCRGCSKIYNIGLMSRLYCDTVTRWITRTI